MKELGGMMLTIVGVVAFLVVIGAAVVQGRTKGMDPKDEALIYWVVAGVTVVLIGALVAFVMSQQ